MRLRRLCGRDIGAEAVAEAYHDEAFVRGDCGPARVLLGDAPPWKEIITGMGVFRGWRRGRGEEEEVGHGGGGSFFLKMEFGR